MLAAAATAVSSLAATGTGATTIPGTPGTGVPAPPALGVHHRLTDATATRILLEDRKVASWLKRYPDKPQKSATW